VIGAKVIVTMMLNAKEIYNAFKESATRQYLDVGDKLQQDCTIASIHPMKILTYFDLEARMIARTKRSATDARVLVILTQSVEKLYNAT